ncbi:unnamed protein product [Lymnaea stagnalis]|uniref:Uncharacterized protein n=1 Tax=Lymnaea stagnalis TaxID=6523 RepID=A0AAV2I6X3_LYMST
MSEAGQKQYHFTPTNLLTEQIHPPPPHDIYRQIHVAMTQRTLGHVFRCPHVCFNLLSPTIWTLQRKCPKKDVTPCFNFSFIMPKVMAVYLISTLLLSRCCSDARHIVHGSPTTHQLDVLRVERSLSFKDASSSLKPAPSLHSTSHNSSPLNSNSLSSARSPPTTDRSSNRNIPQKTNRPPPATADTTASDAVQRSQLISKLISTLEELHVLELSTTSCFRLHKIVYKPEHDSWASQGNSIGVYLSLEKIDRNASLVKNSSDGDVMSNTYAPNTEIAGEPSLLPATCVSNPTVEFVNTTSNSQQSRSPGDMGQQNGTGLRTAPESHTDSVKKRLDDYPNGLSRTQIVVISTCSAIIGLFFLVAAFLRIRNYIKRSRMEQAMANRPKFRSCSVALRNPSQSMEQLRRDSLASKTSHQNSVTTKGSNASQNNGSSRENSSTSSPHHEPDTTPLLIITRPGGLELATPTESNASFHCVDDETMPQKKKPVTPLSLVTNGGTDGCYIVALRQAQLGHVPLAVMERADSLKGWPNPKLERGSSLKSRPNPAIILERRTSLKSCEPTSQNGPALNQAGIPYIHGGVKDGTKFVKNNCQVIKGKYKEKELFNGSPHIYQLMGNSERKQNDKSRTIFLEPKKNGNVDKGFVKTTKGYQIVTNGDIDNQVLPVSKADMGNAIKSLNVKVQIENSVPDENDGINLSSVDQKCGNSTKDEPPQHEDLDLISPVTESSYFGLSQSDCSLSSATNQGNEFFGQSEYHPDVHNGDAPCLDEVVSYEGESHLENGGDLDMDQAETLDVTAAVKHKSGDKYTNGGTYFPVHLVQNNSSKAETMADSDNLSNETDDNWTLSDQFLSSPPGYCGNKDNTTLVTSSKLVPYTTDCSHGVEPDIEQLKPGNEEPLQDPDPSEIVWGNLTAARLLDASSIPSESESTIIVNRETFSHVNGNS